MTAIDIINSLKNHSALHTVNAVMLGRETPLIDSEGLRDHVELLQAADAAEVEAAVKARHRAVEAAKVKTRVGTHQFGGLAIPVYRITSSL